MDGRSETNIPHPPQRLCCAEGIINQEELRAYLGLLGESSQFIPNLIKHIAPLNQLLKAEFSLKPLGKGRKRKGKKTAKHRWLHDPKFTYGPEQKKAFLVSKEIAKKKGNCFPIWCEETTASSHRCQSLWTRHWVARRARGDWGS